MRKCLIMVMLWCGLAASSIAQHTQLIQHTWYTITYNTDQCSPIMGYYVQTAEHTGQLHKVARGTFRKDELAPADCQTDYKGAYATYNIPYLHDLQQRLDKGHVNPFEAFTFDDDAAKETMLYDNVCPQISHVNEQQWRQVEAEVMKRSRAYGDVAVWTGVLISNAHTRYMGDIMVPDYYWKVISYTCDGEPHQEAWLSSNTADNTDNKAIQAATDLCHLEAVIHQYYPDFDPCFNK